jgi:hypothetical protein
MNSDNMTFFKRKLPLLLVEAVFRVVAAFVLGMFVMLLIITHRSNLFTRNL